MFDFLKSKETLIKEAEVHKVGEELFKQVHSATKKVSNEEFTERINSMFSAGYMLGFVMPKLSYLFDEPKLKRKYLEKIISGIFPSSRMEGLDSKLGAYELGKTLIGNQNSKLKPEQLNEVIIKNNHYELGFNAGKGEIYAWEAKAGYIPHLLLDYMITGEIGEL